MANKYIHWIAAPVAAVLLLAGCDLSGIENAPNDFDLIIELQEINTPVAGQIIDQGTLETIPNVDLQFSGDDAGTLIDVYSDPITSAKAPEGVITFGIDNDVVPSESSPVEFQVTAQAPGYVTETVDVDLTSTGSGNFTIRLMPESVTRPVRGTSGVESSSGQASADTGVQDDVVVETPQQSDVQATSQASLSKGTKPLGADGAPLSGSLKTEMRVFDLNRGLRAVPAQLKTGSDEVSVGVTSFRLSDAGGRSAFDFQAEEASQTACGFKLTNRLRDEALYSAVEAGKVTEADVVVSSIAAGENVDVGSVPLTLGDRPEVVSTICVGGTESNVDLSAVRQAASASGKVASWTNGPMYFRASTDAFQMAPLGNIVLDNPNGTKATVTSLAVYSTGVSKVNTSNVNVPANGSKSVATNVDLPEGESATIEVELSTGEVQEHSFTVPSGSFNETVTLAQSTAGAYNVRASLSCGSNQKFEPQITESSFDGLTVWYRIAGAQAAFTQIDDVNVDEVSENSVSASATATLIANEQYTFKAVYDGNAVTKSATAPSSPSESLVIDDISPSDIGGLDCVND